jgi:hypothetical protein
VKPMRDTGNHGRLLIQAWMDAKISTAPEPQSDRPLAAAGKDIDLADWSDHTPVAAAAVGLERTGRPLAAECTLVPAAGSRSWGILHCRPRLAWAEE